jgi:multisubunit Na+/H+ antiporter MnhF subunit
MELFTEAGVFAWVGLLVFTVALIRVVTRPQHATRTASLAAVALLSLGMLGSALGQRMVDRAVEREHVVAQKVALLSAGTRETSSNLLLGAIFALALAGVGAGVSAARDRRQP